MKHFSLLGIVFFVMIAFCQCSTKDTSSRQITNFNFDWRFKLAVDDNFSKPDFDDSQWRSLQLPHDWSIEGEFSPDHPAGTGGGALPGGTGLYRKTFEMSPIAGKSYFIEFDGIYMNSTVWLNGQKIGGRPYGYSSFSIDITPYLKKGTNVMAVKADNSQQPNSRWYSGSGIYRNVRLVETSDVHVAYSGTYVTTPQVSSSSATVNIETTIENLSNESKEVTVVNTVYDANNKQVAQQESDFSVPAGLSIEDSQSVNVASPKLWTIEDPSMYKVVTTVYNKATNVELDTYTTPFGIRTFRFDAQTGFYLNGKPTKILGVCMHHDLGALGAAINVRAMERQLEILKDMGCNGIRTSHNPPAPELLDLCDRMGFIVMDESFDMWHTGKNKYDYSIYFDEWYVRDMQDFVRRDRNHPSIFMWSIGNEVSEQHGRNRFSDNLTELDPAQANLLLNFIKDSVTMSATTELTFESKLTRELANIVRSLDTTRIVTAACQGVDPNNNLYKSGAFDMIGLNYSLRGYDRVPELFPGMPFISTESTSSINTRGFYIHPSDHINIQPANWWTAHETDHHQCSAYDNSHVPWGSTHEDSWLAVRDRDFASGMYIWTGFDYLGEPTPYGWPSRSSYFGIVDLAGFPKDPYYMYRSEWSDKPTLHILPHWNWTKDQEIDVWAYYNQADSVELVLNGKSLGFRSKSKDVLHAVWSRVKWEPGTLTATSYKDGKVVLTETIQTADAASKLVATADRTVINADGEDLSFITIDVTDQKGTLVPDADNSINIEVSGAGELYAVDNGNPISLESFRSNTRKAFNGKALAVIRNNGKSGKIEINLSSEGLEPVKLVVSAK